VIDQQYKNFNTDSIKINFKSNIGSTETSFVEKYWVTSSIFDVYFC